MSRLYWKVSSLLIKYCMSWCVVVKYNYIWFTLTTYNIFNSYLPNSSPWICCGRGSVANYKGLVTLEGSCLAITLVVNLPWKLASTFVFVLWNMIFACQHSWFSKNVFGYVAYNQWVSFNMICIVTHNVGYSGICESNIMQRQSHMPYIITHKFEANLFHLQLYPSIHPSKIVHLSSYGYKVEQPMTHL